MTQDRSRLDDPKETQEDEEFTSFFLCDALDTVKKELTSNYNMKLNPNPSGKFCLHEVFIKEFTFGFKGVELPDGFHFWRKLESHEIGVFRDAVRHICMKHGNQAESKYVKGVWTRVAKAFLEKPSDIRGEVSSLSLASMGDSKDFKLTPITLTGRSGYARVVPQVSWFTAELQAIDPQNLISFLPEAETKQLMLILGRSVVGASTTVAAEGILEHTARSYGILVGIYAGTGKSKFMDAIIDTMTTLGYTHASVPVHQTKFGWGKVACSDLATIDDINPQDQKKIMTSSYIKPLVSNGLMTVEEKGLPRVDVRASTSILINTNSHDYRHYLNMDAGAMSRVNFLEVYSKAQIKAKCGYEDIYQYWLDLAEKLDVHVNTIAAYILARSAEYFLKVSGHYFENGVLVYDRHKDTLMETNLGLKKQFKIKSELTNKTEFVEKLKNLVAYSLSLVHPNELQDVMDKLPHLTISYEIVLPLLSIFAQSKASQQFNPVVDSLIIKEAVASCKPSIQAKLFEFEKLGRLKTSDAGFEVVMKELTSEFGFNYPSSLASYVYDWDVARRDIPELVQYYQANYTKDVPDYVKKAASQVQQVFTAL